MKEQILIKERKYGYVIYFIFIYFYSCINCNYMCQLLVKIFYSCYSINRERYTQVHRQRELMREERDQSQR